MGKLLTAKQVRDKFRHKPNVSDEAKYDELVYQLNNAINNGLFRADGYTYFNVSYDFVSRKWFSLFQGYKFKFNSPEWQRFYEELIDGGYKVTMFKMNTPSHYYAMIRVQWR